jgi:tetratricopeptide (TPR) repeat protein
VSKRHLRRFAYGILIAVLGIAGTAGAYLTFFKKDVTTSSSEAYRLYEKGRENELKLYQRDAIAAYGEALGHDCKFGMAMLRLGANLYDRDPGRARSLVQAAVNVRDDLSRHERLLVDVYAARALEQGAEKEALAIEAFVKAFPSDPEGHMLRAGLLSKQGKPELAQAEFETLLTIDPNYATAYNSLGYYAIGRGEFKKAEDYFLRYRFLAPDQANPYDSLGELYANTGRYEEAEENLTKALAIKPDFFPSHGHLGTMRFGKGDFRGAAEEFETAASIIESPLARLDFTVAAALSLREGGETDRALALLEAWQAEVKSSLTSEATYGARPMRAQLLIAVIQALSGRATEAEASLAEAKKMRETLVAKHPDRKKDTEGGIAVAEALLKGASGDKAGAIQDLEKVVAKPPDREFGYFPGEMRTRVRLAELYADLGRNEEAAEALKPVLARNPRFAPALGLANRIGLAVPEKPAPTRS